MRVRKKPVVIDAYQWFKNGDHPEDYTNDSVDVNTGAVFTKEFCKLNNWEGEVVRYFCHPDVEGQSECKHCGEKMHKHGWIDTLEGGHIVCPGDWIITGVEGEYYPCKPDIFAKTYEEVK